MREERKMAFYEIGEGKLGLEFQGLFEKAQNLYPPDEIIFNMPVFEHLNHTMNLGGQFVFDFKEENGEVGILCKLLIA